MLAVACLIAYLVGGIPFGLLFVRLATGRDVRTIGSGNIGATNAARAFARKRTRVLVFVAIYVLDFAKGWLPTLLLPDIVPDGGVDAAVAIGTCAVLGHCFSPYLRFTGGKGVATGCGVFAALEPFALLVGLAGFALAYALTRKVFIGSLTLGVTLAAAVVLRDPATALHARRSATALALAVAVFFFFTHRSNLRQALAGGARP